MRDLETGSLWSHLMGKAMKGDLKGTELEMLDGTLATWGEWRTQHPKTTVLAMSRTARGFDESVWKEPGRFVYGVRLGPLKPKPAVALPHLVKVRVVQVSADGNPIVFTIGGGGMRVQAFDPTVDGSVLRFRAGKDGAMLDQETGSRWNVVTGECVTGSMKGQRLSVRPGMISYRKAWTAFYPDAKIVE